MVASIKNDKLIDTAGGHLVRSYSSSYGGSSAIPMFSMLPLVRGFWPFSSVDENTNLRDISGQQRVMQNTNTVAYGVSGLVTYADFIRANSEYFTAADGAWNSIFDEGLAVAAWVRFDAESSGNNVGIISKWVATASNNRTFALIKTNGNIFRFLASDDGIAEFNVDSSVVYEASKWYFILGLAERSTSLKIFVNGTWDVEDASVPGSLYDSTAPLLFGSYDGGNYLDGRMSMAVLGARSGVESISESIYHHSRALFGIRS